MKWVFIAYGLAWLATGLAISVAIYFTHSITPLWFFLMPMLINIKGYSGNKEDKENRDDNNE